MAKLVAISSSSAWCLKKQTVSKKLPPLFGSFFCCQSVVFKRITKELHQFKPWQSAIQPAQQGQDCTSTSIIISQRSIGSETSRSNYGPWILIILFEVWAYFKFDIMWPFILHYGIMKFSTCRAVLRVQKTNKIRKKPTKRHQMAELQLTKVEAKPKQHIQLIRDKSEDSKGQGWQCLWRLDPRERPDQRNTN